ncbi:MAG: hemerythrin family protein [Deltaproteobacteria bacterium]|jgi:hemerythrin|nr:hemerythrin family protein [Deltaproteobacteria bacterium]
MLELTRDMLTGVAKIDEQHKELISRINAVMNMGSKSASPEETRKTIDFLNDYVIKHFGDEEVLQRQAQYPKYEEHKKLHQIYIGEIRKLREEFMANGPSPKFAVSLNNSIIGWIVKHIKNVDVEFGKYCQTKGI